MQIVAVVDDTPVSQQLSPVAGLLQFLPADISMEIAYNKREAALQPHCCVCSLFVAVIDLSSSSCLDLASAIVIGWLGGVGLAIKWS